MTKGKAVCAIIRDARTERGPSNASVKRVMNAIKALDLSEEDTRFVLSYLDICRFADGSPYGKIVRIW